MAPEPFLHRRDHAFSESGKGPIYALMRVCYLFFLGTNGTVFLAITVIGSLSVLGGHLMALRQDDIKRLLAYSTVAQIGYILIGVGCASAAGAAAAVFHAFNHMLMKTGLFITAGSLAEEKGTREICGLTGLWKSRPAWVAAFAVLSAAIVGIPPLNGFMSKWFIILSSAETGTVIPALVIAAGTVISAAYYIRVLSTFMSPGEMSSGDASTPSSLKTRRRKGISMAITGIFALLCLVVGVMAFSPFSREFFTSTGWAAVDVGAYVRLVTGR